MIGDILNAVLNECKALLQTVDIAGTIILETDYKSDKLVTYSMPLLILDMIDAPEASQYLGGVTRMDWVFGMNSYNLQPDSYIDDVTPWSGSLLDIIDRIRAHFSLGFWLVAGRTDQSLPMAMADIEMAYGFKFTLSGLTRANNLDQDGLVMGWRIMFDSIAIDDATDWILLKQTLTTVTPILPDDD